jgi:ribose transport system ATP-binding protein
MAPLLRMGDIRKSFLGVEVLHGVSLECEEGEIHAVVGENGAGKSTLMKVLAGVYQPDGGEVAIDGKPVHFSHPVQAQAAGVAIIFQEFNLLPDRTVAENVYVGREPARRGVVDRRTMEQRTAELLEEVGEVSFGPGTLVRRLSTAQQQVVEIVKALSLDARLLVLDEPTAALAAHEVEVLFGLLRRLRERGLGMVYISHRLREIFAICDRITVLKDGEHVATLPVAEVDTGKLISLMVGRELDGYFPPRGTPEELGDVRLRATGITTSLLDDVSLEVRAGEIVGRAGLQGSGRTEMARALFGADPYQGTVEVDGKKVGRGPRAGIRAGMGFITEDRKLEGLALAQTIRDNTLLALRSIGGRQRRRLPNTVLRISRLHNRGRRRSAG